MATIFSHKHSLRPSVKHFSHCHPLRPFEVKEESEVICSGCELDLFGSAYKCTKSKCDFFLHKPCFELPRELQHKSHHEHPLTLLYSPPYGDDSRFTCDACMDYGTAFVYHCSTCQYDLHVGCATMPETLEREDHQHPLTLFYSSSCDRGYTTFICGVCSGNVPQSCWVYYCPDCDCGTHLGCATAIAEEFSKEEPKDSKEEEPEGSKEESEGSKEELVLDSVRAAQEQLQMLQISQIELQMSNQRAQVMRDMSYQSAQMIRDIGRSLANL